MAQQKQKQQNSNKRCDWTNRKISQLVELYKKHECLWNHFHKSYRSKEKRYRAIEEICNTLGVTESDYSKKIHCLRTQFMQQIKKFEQSLEKAGDGIQDVNTIALCTKWWLFESLEFLRPFIGNKTIGNKTTEYKKMCFNFNYNRADEVTNATTVLPSTDRVPSIKQEEVPPYQYEDNATASFQTFKIESSNVTQTIREEIYDKKFQPEQRMTVEEPTENNKKSLSSAQHSLSCSSSLTAIININDDSTIEQNSNDLTDESSNSQLITTSSSIITPVISAVTSNYTSNRPASRDQWDVFGELVANEFRNLSSDVSRRHLKRKFMQAMLEIEEEDDNLK